MKKLTTSLIGIFLLGGLAIAAPQTTTVGTKGVFEKVVWESCSPDQKVGIISAGNSTYSRVFIQARTQDFTNGPTVAARIIGCQGKTYLQPGQSVTCLLGPNEAVVLYRKRNVAPGDENKCAAGVYQVGFNG